MTRVLDWRGTDTKSFCRQTCGHLQCSK